MHIILRIVAAELQTMTTQKHVYSYAHCRRLCSIAISLLNHSVTNGISENLPETALIAVIDDTIGYRLRLSSQQLLYASTCD